MNRLRCPDCELPTVEDNNQVPDFESLYCNACYEKGAQPMNTHTPGTWYTSDKGPSSPHYQGQVAVEETGRTIAITYDDEGGHNARLIAAAPDCLRVLKLLANCQNYCMEGGKLSYELQAVLTEAENVIATATDCTVRRLPK